MSHTTPSAFLDPLIHGFESVCKKIGSLVGASHTSPHGSTRDVPIPEGRRSVTTHSFGDENEDFPWMVSPARHRRDLVNLPAVVEQLAAQYEEIADERSVHIFVNVAPDALVIGDGASLHWVLAQLLAIAVDEAPFGGLVVISGAVSNGRITLTLSEHYPNRLLHAWPHSRDVPSQSAKGHEPEEEDLRPSVVGEILSAHGGRMKMMQPPGEGSRFEIRLPVG